MNSVQEGWVEAYGGRLYYEASGEGDPLVLVHGFSLDRRMWDDQYRLFSQHYHVIRYDLRGFGQSTLPQKAYRHVDDLNALLDHFNIARAHLMGLSLGGEVLLDFALTCPEMVRSLIVVDSVLGGFVHSPEWVTSIHAISQQARQAGTTAALELWRSHPLFAPALEQSAVATRLNQMIMEYSGWHFVNRDPIQRLAPPAAQRLAAITTPTLIVLGERDLPDFHAIADTLSHHLLHSRNVVLPAVGHMANMEAPALFNKIVLNFLSEQP